MTTQCTSCSLADATYTLYDAGAWVDCCDDCYAETQQRPMVVYGSAEVSALDTGDLATRSLTARRRADRIARRAADPGRMAVVVYAAGVALSEHLHASFLEAAWLSLLASLRGYLPPDAPAGDPDGPLLVDGD